MSAAVFKKIAEFGALPPAKAHEVIERGVKARTVEYLREGLSLPTEAVAVLIGNNVRTVQRLRATPDKVLDTNTAGRLYRASAIVKKAADILGSPDVAIQWLKSEQRALNDQTPFALMQTEAGAAAVEALLGRIEYGVYT